MTDMLLLALPAGTLSVLLAQIVMRYLDARRFAPRARRVSLDRGLEPMVFLFHQHRLIDATGPARALLAGLSGSNDWQKLTVWLAMRMPDVASLPARLQEDVRVELTHQEGASGRPLRLLAEVLAEDRLRLTLSDPTSQDAGIVVDSLSLSAMEDELDMLRNVLDRSPMLAWREDDEGAITWANSAYIQLAERRGTEARVWPLPRLIDLPQRALPPIGPRRAEIEDGGRTHWYECHSRRIGDQSVGIALPADAAVRAERSLREFIHTLTKTFADLPIGLAIFDKDRALQLFNPALIDLTGLSAGFLTARPTLYAFLHRLREARMVPEPKDYRSWRNQMSSLEHAAASGHHVETWSLPGGQTYRVTGRPHPDGAVAFLFEDITSEVSLTRKFRADLSLGKEVLDALEDAVAVFNGNGQLATLNSSYQTLWGEGLQGGLNDHLGLWMNSAGDGPGLQALRKALETGRSAIGEGISGAMRGPSGEILPWSLRYLMGGRLMVRFGPATPALAPSTEGVMINPVGRAPQEDKMTAIPAAG